MLNEPQAILRVCFTNREYEIPHSAHFGGQIYAFLHIVARCMQVCSFTSAKIAFVFYWFQINVSDGFIIDVFLYVFYRHLFKIIAQSVDPKLQNYIMYWLIIFLAGGGQQGCAGQCQEEQEAFSRCFFVVRKHVFLRFIGS